jgi:hypothetical protein
MVINHLIQNHIRAPKSRNCLRAVDGDRSTSSREVALGGHNLVVVLTELHALAGPRIKVRLQVDRTAGALVLANRPVLLKGRGAVNGWLVGTSALGNLVRGAVRGDGTLVLRLRGRVVGTEVLNDVVLDERVAGPAVDGKVRVAVGVVGARVCDGTVLVVRELVLQVLRLAWNRLTEQIQGSIPFLRRSCHRFPRRRCSFQRCRWCR